MPPSPATEEPDNIFICDCVVQALSACKGLPFYKGHDAKQYCVLHYPGGEKSADFDEALQVKLKAEDFDFRGVWFPDGADFSNRTFAKPVSFDFATFSAVAYFYNTMFSAEAAFSKATFCAETNFGSAEFGAKTSFDAVTFDAEANFDSITFGAEASFVSATFSARASFHSAAFGARTSFASAAFGAEATFDFAKFCADAFFRYATFGARASFDRATFSAEAFFGYATFKDYVIFAGTEGVPIFRSESSLNLQFARIDKPERVSFHTVELHPYYFVNVDPRKFEFTSVDWHWYAPNVWNALQVRGKLKRQLREKLIPSYRVLAVACRRLAVNAEENNFYRNASSFRYLAMNVERLGTGHGFGLWTVDWWYWLASGFGERIPRALIAFFLIWLSFAFLFWLPSPVRCPENISGAYCLRWEKKEGKTGDYFEGFANSAAYAIEAMTLQKPEPKPASPAAHLAVLLCAILGPVQAALLALAIRRKFMR